MPLIIIMSQLRTLCEMSAILKPFSITKLLKLDHIHKMAAQRHNVLSKPTAWLKIQTETQMETPKEIPLCKMLQLQAVVRFIWSTSIQNSYNPKMVLSHINKSSKKQFSFCLLWLWNCKYWMMGGQNIMSHHSVDTRATGPSRGNSLQISTTYRRTCTEKSMKMCI